MAQKRKGKKTVARRKNRRERLVLLGVFVATFLFAFLVAKFKNNETVDAANLGAFDAGYIISDYQMGNYNSMSEADIQNFLKQKGNCNDTRTYLADYYTSYSYHIRDGHFVCLADETFGEGTAYGDSAPYGASAAHIIWQAAQDYRINPQVLIVLLQKEQGLITDSWPNNRQYRSATGYGCPDTAACDSKYYGFKNQVRNAAAMFRTVLDGGWTNYPLGNNYIQYNPNSSCGGSWVNIRSLATSALYRYTPYQPNASALAAGYGSGDSCGAYGNRNFYLYFEDWFGGITMTQSSTRVPDGDYYIQLAENASFVVDVMGGKSDNGTNIQLYSKNNTLAQQWNITYNSATDDYNIVNIGTGKALDVYGAEVSDGANVQLWDGNKTCAQRWKIIGSYFDEIKFSSSCSGKVMDIMGGKVFDGSNLQIWIDNDTVAQRWKLVPVDVVPDGVYNISSVVDSKKMVDVVDGVKNAENGTNIQIWNKNNTAAQRWYIERDKDGYYTITNLQADKRMDVEGGQSENGANVQLWGRNNSCAQKWRILSNKGKYSFISACSQKVIDVYNANRENGVNVQLYSANNTSAQKWNLELADIVESGEYSIVSKLSSSKVLDLAGDLGVDGANIQLYDVNLTLAQKWNIIYDAETDSYEIVNIGNNKAVDVESAKKENGANVQLWRRNNTCAQRWDIVDSGNGYVFYSLCSGLVMDVMAGQISNGANIQLYQYNGTNAQRWVLR